MFENFPYTNFHNLNMDWIIEKIKTWLDHYDELSEAIENKLNRPDENPAGLEGEFLISNGDGTTSWLDYDPISEERIKEEVDEWLSQHPEYIIDIQDNSIASQKLKKQSIPFYCVEDYGIHPDSGDVYEALHDFFRDYVYNTGGIVYFPEGTYTLGFTLFIPENTTIMGAGPDKTEIFFNQESTHFGVGLCNAGSNVKICNMKLSQYSTGIFHTGSQPGCMAFSTIDKTQVLEDAYSHTYITAESGQTENLTIENVTFDGFYAIGVENRPGTLMKNITVRNIIAPNACVSVRPHANDTVEDVLIENVECDLFRLGTHLETTGVIRRLIANNIKCTTISYFNSEPLVLNNVTLNDTTKNNDVSFDSNASSKINGPIVFNNSSFKFTENVGFYVINGIRTFNDCKWDAKYRFVTRGGSLDNFTNYDIFNNNVLKTAHEGSSTVLLVGYGNNNVFIDTYEGKSIKNLLIGDCYKSHTHATTGKIHYYNGQFIMQLDNAISNTNSITTFSESEALCQNSASLIPIRLIDTANHANDRMTYGQLANGVLAVTETGYTNSTSYNKAFVLSPFIPTDVLGPASFYNNFA